MRTRPSSILALVSALLASFALASCGESAEEGHHEVVEGEALEIGEVRYNVVLSRFLNPNLVEDGAYVEDAPPEPPNKSYFGVFIRIENEDEDEPIPSAASYEVHDQNDRAYEPVESGSLYELELGALLAADGQLPEDDSPAAESPTQGALLLFLVDDDVSEERPLELEVIAEDGEGTIELDI